MNPRISKDVWGLQLAAITAQRGTCCRRQVGAVLLDGMGHVIATGYNGVAAGLPHCNDPLPDTGRKYMGQQDAVVTAKFPNACSGADAPSGTNLDACQAIHAEANALLQCRDVQQIHTCYVTCSPCISCVKMLMNTTCQRIIFAEEYPHPASKVLWTSAGREWIQLGIQD